MSDLLTRNGGRLARRLRAVRRSVPRPERRGVVPGGEPEPRDVREGFLLAGGGRARGQSRRASQSWRRRRGSKGLPKGGKKRIDRSDEKGERNVFSHLQSRPMRTRHCYEMSGRGRRPHQAWLRIQPLLPGLSLPAPGGKGHEGSVDPSFDVGVWGG